MSTTKFYPKTNRPFNLNYLVRIMYFLLLLGLMLSVGNNVFAEFVSDLKAELDSLATGECVTISKSSRTDFYNVEPGSIPAIPAVKVKGTCVVAYINACLEEFSSVSVMKAEKNGYFYVFDPGYEPRGSQIYPGLYGGFFGGMWGGGYGGYYGFPTDSIYRYGSGINSGINFGNMFDPYAGILGLSMGLYNNPSAYQGGSFDISGLAQGLFATPVLGLSGLFGLSGLDPLSSMLWLYGNTPLNNRVNAIPSENGLINGDPTLRSAHFSGLINPIYSGYGFAPGFSLSPFTYSFPRSVFGMF